MLMWLTVLSFLVGCFLLAWSADRFVVGSSHVARNFGVSPLVVGIVLVGFATSLPEFLVSVMAVWHGQMGIALGNALGSYTINITLVLGVTALVFPLVVRTQLLKREFPLLVASFFLVYVLLADGYLGVRDGVLMLIGFCGLLGTLLYMAWKYRHQQDDALVEACVARTATAAMSSVRAVFWVVLGFVLLLVSARVLVLSATFIAKAFGMSDLVIGLTIVAVGTSLPELAASVASVLRGEHDIALGNVLGSNMLGVLAVTSVPGMLSPGPIPSGVLHRDLPIMAVATVLLLAVCFPKIKGAYRIHRWKGAVLLGYFVLYLGMLY